MRRGGVGLGVTEATEGRALLGDRRQHVEEVALTLRQPVMARADQGLMSKF